MNAPVLSSLHVFLWLWRARPFRRVYCHGLVALLAAILGYCAPAPVVAQTPMVFAFVPVRAAGCANACPNIMVAVGDIVPQTADDFTLFLRTAHAAYGQDASRLRPVLYLHSRGGNVWGAMRLGALLRAQNITVVVAEVFEVRGQPAALAGVCVSACVYAMMGGIRRLVPQKALVGIHSMATPEYVRVPERLLETRYTETPQSFVNALRRYARKMGIDAAMIDVAQSIARNDMHFVSEREMIVWHFAERPKYALDLLR